MRKLFDGILTLVLVCSAVSVAVATWRRSGAATGAVEIVERPAYVKSWRVLQALGHVEGPATAPVQLIVFSDFECPYCKLADQALRALRTETPNAFNLTFVHFPIAGHRFSRIAAQASECAHEEGRFASMRSTLFDSQDSLGSRDGENLHWRQGLLIRSPLPSARHKLRSALVLKQEGVPVSSWGFEAHQRF